VDLTLYTPMQTLVIFVLCSMESSMPCLKSHYLWIVSFFIWVALYLTSLFEIMVDIKDDIIYWHYILCSFQKMFQIMSKLRGGSNTKYVPTQNFWSKFKNLGQPARYNEVGNLWYLILLYATLYNFTIYSNSETACLEVFFKETFISLG
jgi:hypothetical protein